MLGFILGSCKEGFIDCNAEATTDIILSTSYVICIIFFSFSLSIFSFFNLSMAFGILQSSSYEYAG